MSKKFIFYRYFLFIAIIIYCALQPGFLSADETKAVDLKISGKVLYNGNPFEGAEIYLQTNEWVDNSYKSSLKKIGITGTDGSFSFNASKKRNQGMDVIAYKKGTGIGWCNIFEKRNTENLKINIFPAKSKISGVVTDEKGNPLPDADVKISAFQIKETVNFENSRLHLYSEIPGTFTKTDAKGRFAFNEIPDSSGVAITFNSTGYADYDCSGINSGEENLEIKLVPEGCITGRVTYANTGNPVKNFKILTKITDKSAITDQNGYYKITNLPEGVYDLVPVMNEKKFDTWAVAVNKNIGVDPGKTTANVDFKLIKGILITGKVTVKETGEPVSGIKVATQCKTVDIDKNGVYKLYVSPGDIQLQAHTYLNEEYQNRIVKGENDTSITVSPSDKIIKINMQVRKAVTIKGIVKYPDGSPAKYAQVGVYPIYNFTDKQGNFSWEIRLPGKNFTITADVPEQELEGFAVVESKEGAFVEITLKPYEYFTVSGKTLDENKMPVSGVKISLVRSAGLESSERDSAAVSDIFGNFKIDKLRKNRRYLLTARDGQAFSVYFRAGKDPGPFEIVIPKGDKWFGGRITDENGNPVKNQELTIWYSHGYKNALTDTAGYYNFEYLSADNIELSLNSKDYGYYNFGKIKINTKNNFVLRKKDRYLTGYIFDKNNKPVSGARVIVNQSNYGSRNLDAVTDTNGKFRLRELVSDKVNLEISGITSTITTISDVKTNRNDVKFVIK